MVLILQWMVAKLSLVLFGIAIFRTSEAYADIYKQITIAERIDPASMFPVLKVQ